MKLCTGLQYVLLITFFFHSITVFKRKNPHASAINSTYMLRPLKGACCVEEVSAENGNILRSKHALLEDII